MKEHRIRLIAIAACTLAVLVGEIVLIALGKFDSAPSAVLTGSLTILLPALVDANAVERRRVDPAQKAIEDDRKA